MAKAVRDYSSVGQARRLKVLAAIRRRRCELDATETAVLAAMAADPDPYRDGAPDLGKQWVREDVACALRLPSATAGHKLAVATEITNRFPATLAAMRAGHLDSRYAERLVETALELPVAAASKVEAQVLERAASQTLAQFGASVRRAVAAVDTRAAEDKHAAARAQRRVVFAPADNGMVEQWSLQPAEQAAAMQSAVDQLADSWQGMDDRTADQRRADALYALTTGCGRATHPTAGGARVNVTVALSTLLHLDDQPGELDGHGTIPASIARSIAFDPDARWRRLLVDKRGQVVDSTSARYRPPAATARFVQLRDRTCQFPGCRRRASTCELDHITAWAAGGTTTPGNLLCLCARHHHLKHDGGWRVTRNATTGQTTWTNPVGTAWSRPPPEPPPL